MGRKIGAYAKLFDLPAIQIWIGAVALGVRFGIDNSFTSSITRLFLALAAITLVLFYMMSLNDYFDKEIDAMKGERSVLVLGEVGQGQAKLLITILAVAGLATGYLISAPFFFLLLGFFVLASLYSAPPIRFKRKYPFSTFGEVTAVFLLFPLGYSAVQVPTPQAFLVSSMTTFIAAGYRLRHEARHVEFDTATGKRTFAVVHGADVVASASRAALLIGGAEVPILFVLGYLSPVAAALATIFVLVPVVLRVAPHWKDSWWVSFFWGYGVYLLALLLPK